MKSCLNLTLVAALLLIAGISSVPGFAADKPQTLIGQVSDSMCGAKHAMQGSAADCTHACVKQGSSFALVVKDRVYNIETSDKALQDSLDKLAGENAKVTGTVKGDSIEASAVSPAQ